MTINLMHPLPLNDAIAPMADHPPVRKRSNVIGNRTPAWFGMPDLTEAMDYMRLRTPALVSPSRKELALRAKNVQKHEIGFISNSKFAADNAALQIFSVPLALTPTNSQVDALYDQPVPQNLSNHLSQLCGASLLTQAQESSLFERMNFLRFQAAIQRALLIDEAHFRARLQLIDQLLALADWHRDRIIEGNTRLVFSVVKKFVNKNNPFDDLLSEGVVALMHAVNKFDFDRGFRFSTYATTVLRRNAYREVLDNQERRLKTATGLHEMKIDLVDEQNDQRMGENRWQLLRGRLGDMLSELDRREKFIIRARFSLGSHRRVSTLQALAKRLGVSKERVRQLERRGLEKLQVMAVKSEAV